VVDSDSIFKQQMRFSNSRRDAAELCTVCVRVDTFAIVRSLRVIHNAP
jgi:hypothetical protein